MTMGQRITQRRKQLGLSQEALADAVGVSRQAVSKWELDEAQPDAAKIVLLAKALDMTTDELLLGAAEAETPAGQTAPSAPPPPQSDRPRRLERFVRRHGYKAGYILIAWGLVLLLVAGAGFLMFRGFFAAADESFREFNGFSQSIIPGGSAQGGMTITPADGVTLTDEELAIIERELAGQAGLSQVRVQTHAFPVALQRAVYAVLALPAIFGAALVVTGIVVIVKYKKKSDA